MGSAAGQPLPVPYQGQAGQVLTLVAAQSTDTTATLIGWQRSAGGWQRGLGPFTAYVGWQGIGRASEGSTRTPAGVWGLTEAFGRRPATRTRMPYRRVDASDWWVSDTKSPKYNTLQRCAPGTCPFNEAAGEDLGQAGPVYDHAIVIDYNRNPVTPGAGSAFFLHISAGHPTQGCVSMPADNLRAVLAWLDPAQHPVINIGVSP
ncbi:MAG: hypothetical protein HOQ24_19825 [Mycobacteriaceae bacterium]|nr:hypothetical protein [Mycobacteriaceae bacterium]